MKHSASILVVSFVMLAQQAPAVQGPAGASGACSHVIGPVDSSGNPVDFSCTDVGGSALLVWNASDLSSAVSVSGGIKTVNFYPGDFTVSGVFDSDGAIAFIGGGITVSGRISGASVLIAGAGTTSTDVSNTLLGPAPARIVSDTLLPVVVDQTGKITATSGNVVIAGQNIQNFGEVTAAKGSAILKTGTKLDIGWDDVTWVEGKQSIFNDLSIANRGSITASEIVLEAQRFAGNTSIFNSGTLTGTKSITFVTGTPGDRNPDGSYQPETFGIVNEQTGQLVSASIVITPYFQADPGGAPKARVFDTKQEVQRTQVQTDLGTGTVLPNQDNTPTGASAPVIDSTQTFTVTGNIVVPQLAPSLTNLNTTPITQRNATPIAQANATPMPGLNATGFTHLNATSKGATLASVNDGSEQLRGEGAQPRTVKPKARAKAKPVLVRGAFFDSKISAVITSNR
jgi:hypothetical protein